MNTLGWYQGLAGGAIDCSSRVVGGAVGCTTCSNARVDGIVEDVPTSTLATTLGGIVREGVDWWGGMEGKGHVFQGIHMAYMVGKRNLVER